MHEGEILEKQEKLESSFKHMKHFYGDKWQEFQSAM
jgi:hypothetical protein